MDSPSADRGLPNALAGGVPSAVSCHVTKAHESGRGSISAKACIIPRVIKKTVRSSGGGEGGAFLD
jgi:hypothetical protein